MFMFHSGWVSAAGEVEGYWTTTDGVRVVRLRCKHFMIDVPMATLTVEAV